jgi:hypothetical protein
VAGEGAHDVLRSSCLVHRRFVGKKDTARDDLKTVWLYDLNLMQYPCQRPLVITIFAEPDTRGPPESLTTHYFLEVRDIRFYGSDPMARVSGQNRPFIKYLTHMILCKSTETNSIHYMFHPVNEDVKK